MAVYVLDLICALIVLPEFIKLTIQFCLSAYWPKQSLRLDMGKYKDKDIYFENKESKEIAANKECRIGEEGGHNQNCNTTPFIQEEKMSLIPYLNVPHLQQFAPAQFILEARKCLLRHFEEPSHITMCKCFGKFKTT